MIRFLVALVLVGAVACSSSSGGSNSDLDKRTCEIARDIGASFNVTDTLEESRARVVDLYDGYGKAASPAIQEGLREWSAGLTSGDLHGAANGISKVDSACSAEGF